MKKFVILLMIAFVAIGIAGAYNWPMENGAIQLSKTNVSVFDSPYFANAGIGLSPGVIGPTPGQLAFASDEGEGAIPEGYWSPKSAFLGNPINGNDSRAM